MFHPVGSFVRFHPQLRQLRQAVNNPASGELVQPDLTPCGQRTMDSTTMDAADDGPSSQKSIRRRATFTHHPSPRLKPLTSSATTSSTASATTPVTSPSTSTSTSFLFGKTPFTRLGKASSASASTLTSQLKEEQQPNAVEPLSPPPSASASTTQQQLRQRSSSGSALLSLTNLAFLVPPSPAPAPSDQQPQPEPEPPTVPATSPVTSTFYQKMLIFGRPVSIATPFSRKTSGDPSEDVTLASPPPLTAPPTTPKTPTTATLFRGRTPHFFPTLRRKTSHTTANDDLDPQPAEPATFHPIIVEDLTFNPANRVMLKGDDESDHAASEAESSSSSRNSLEAPAPSSSFPRTTASGFSNRRGHRRSRSAAAPATSDRKKSFDGWVPWSLSRKPDHPPTHEAELSPPEDTVVPHTVPVSPPRPTSPPPPPTARPTSRPAKSRSRSRSRVGVRSGAWPGQNAVATRAGGFVIPAGIVPTEDPGAAAGVVVGGSRALPTPPALRGALSTEDIARSFDRFAAVAAAAEAAALVQESQPGLRPATPSKGRPRPVSFAGFEAAGWTAPAAEKAV
ncbi:hypothetical protein HDU96_007991 [Phlyctochytrium bullatum]|nr:hypothetical protein HDU96_007991 [Phlyctochytrium bullatum]